MEVVGNAFVKRVVSAIQFLLWSLVQDISSKFGFSFSFTLLSIDNLFYILQIKRYVLYHRNASSHSINFEAFSHDLK